MVRAKSALMAGLLLATAGGGALAHTVTMGYTVDGSTVTLWYGTYHGSTFNEGSVSLTGPNGTSIARFNLLASTLPTGLVAGTNYFQSNGTALVAAAPGTASAWQGAQFSGLVNGSYGFRYIPVGDPQSYDPTGTPTSDWQPMDAVIQGGPGGASLNIQGVAPSGPDPLLTALAAREVGMRAATVMQLQQHQMLGNVQSADCAQFGANGACIGVAAAFGQVGTGTNEFRGMVTAAVRLGYGFSIGGFVDQPAANSSPAGVVRRGDLPTVGAFVKWAQAEDGTGLRMRLAYAQGNGRLTMTRPVLGTTEPGTGSAPLDYNSFGGEVGYGMRVAPAWIAQPYAGMWQTSATRGAYSEGTANGTAFPLTYARYRQSMTTATAGLAVQGQLSDVVAVRLRAGVEADAATSRNRMAATSAIPGLAAMSATVTGPVNQVRAVVGAGVSYAIAPNQAVGLDAGVRQLPYGSALGTNAVLHYALSF